MAQCSCLHFLSMPTINEVLQVTALLQLERGIPKPSNLQTPSWWGTSSRLAEGQECPVRWPLMSLPPRTGSHVWWAMLERASKLCWHDMQKQLHMALQYTQVIAKILQLKKAIGTIMWVAQLQGFCYSCKWSRLSQKLYKLWQYFCNIQKQLMILLTKMITIISWAAIATTMITRVGKATAIISQVVKAITTFSQVAKTIFYDSLISW